MSDPSPTLLLDRYQPALRLVAEVTRWSARFATELAAESSSAGGSASKADATPVTAADLALQAVLVAGLREAYGDVPVVGEESTAIFAAPGGDRLRSRVHALVHQVRPSMSARAIDDAIDAGAADGTSDRHWVIDPIDGTRGYLRGQQYCVCLALVEAGRPVFGAAGCPRLGRHGLVLAASAGGGAWCWDGRSPSIDEPPSSVAVRSARESGAPIVACESPEATDRARLRLRRLGEALGVPLIARPMESQCKFVLVALGESDLAVRFASSDPAKNRDMVWDYAGAVVFAEEAGAAMTDCDGAALRFGRGRSIDGNRGILCAPRWLHADAVQACRTVDVAIGALPIGARSRP
jgi:3'(2'), 5'-bisphosphate nucleotidase